MKCWVESGEIERHRNAPETLARRHSLEPEIDLGAPLSPETGLLEEWASTVRGMKHFPSEAEMGTMRKIPSKEDFSGCHLDAAEDGEAAAHALKLLDFKCPSHRGSLNVEMPSINSARSSECHLEDLQQGLMHPPSRRSGGLEADLHIMRMKLFISQVAPLSPSVASTSSGERSPLRFSRRASVQPRDVDRMFTAKINLQSLDFDVTNLDHAEHVELLLEMFVQLDLHDKMAIPEDELKDFIWMVEEHMFDNPYHNWDHVADVSQALYSMAVHSGVLDRLTDLEAFALLISILCHDLEHPGVSNVSLVNDTIFLEHIYGETSLEMYHARRAETLLNHETRGITRFLGDEQASALLEIVRTNILATEMSRHNEFLAQLDRVLEEDGPECSTALAMQLLMKCADISNAVRPFPIAKKWAIRVTNEFYRQGDLEKAFSLPLTAICDRKNNSRAEIQRGFIDYVIVPLFSKMSRAFPGLEPSFGKLSDNRAEWAAIEDEDLCSDISFSIIYQ